VAVRRVNCLALAVSVTLHQDAERPIGFVDSPDLVGDDVGRLIPGDADVLALAAVLRVPLSLGIPVNPLHWVLDAVRGEGALLIGERERRGQGLHQWRQRLAIARQRPRPETRAVILPVIVERPDAHDLAVLQVEGAFAASAQHPAQGKCPHDGIIRFHVRLAFFISHFALYSSRWLVRHPATEMAETFAVERLSLCAPA